MRLWAVETLISQTCLSSWRSLAVGLLYHMQEKTRLTRETCIIQNTLHVFTQLWNISIRQFKTFKKISCIWSQLHWETAKMMTQACWNHLESKNILQNVMLRDYDKDWCTLNNSQKLFSEVGKTLAPRAYEGRGERRVNVLHQNQNNVFSQQTSNKIWSAIVLHPQK